MRQLSDAACCRPASHALSPHHALRIELSGLDLLLECIEIKWTCGLAIDGDMKKKSRWGRWGRIAWSRLGLRRHVANRNDRRARLWWRLRRGLRVRLRRRSWLWVRPGLRIRPAAAHRPTRKRRGAA